MKLPRTTMYKSLCGLFSLVWGKSPGVMLLGHMVSVCLTSYFQNVFRTVRIQTSGDVKLKAISLELIFKAGGQGTHCNAHAPYHPVVSLN